jgi:hypothetical protein
MWKMEPAVTNAEILSKPVCVPVLIVVSWMLVNVASTMLQLVVDDHIGFLFSCSKALKAGK